ncbi:MAG: hypothetical protein PHC51_10320, partial [bacterium]|nr:hypothetical protein [bacterium]
ESFQLLIEDMTAGYPRKRVAELELLAEASMKLGLNRQAIIYYDEIILHRDVTEAETARAYLGKALQFAVLKDYQNSLNAAQKCEESLKGTELTAQCNLLAASASSETGKLSDALLKAKEAVSLSAGEYRNEALLLLGRLQHESGDDSAARETFLDIPLSSIYASKAILELFNLALAAKNGKEIALWAEQAQERGSSILRTGRLEYIHLIEHCRKGDIGEAERLLVNMRKEYDESNAWLKMAESRLEGVKLEKFSNAGRITDVSK